MIELLSDLPDGVVGVRVSGHLSGDDLRGIEPKLKEAVGTSEVRIVEVIASDYAGFGPGGLAEDLKFGLGTVMQHRSALKKIAMVTDKDWVHHTLHAMAWMVPGELRMFGLDELEQAKEWAAA